MIYPFMHAVHCLGITLTLLENETLSEMRFPALSFIFFQEQNKTKQKPQNTQNNQPTSESPGFSFGRDTTA